MKRAIDYDPVADLYDAYVPFAADVPFFVEETSRAGGPVLELMAGTGRVTIPLLEAGVPLYSVDYSAGMLGRLRAKLVERGLPVRVALADARDLPFTGRFELAILPFNSFAELVDRDDQMAALGSVRDALVREGSFVITLHNPRVRLRTIDGVERTIGRFPHPDGVGEIVLRVRFAFDDRARVATGVQILEEVDAGGARLRERRVDVRFALPDRAAIEARCRAMGFKIEALYGDYDRSAYREESSPYMIWRLRRD